MFYDCHPNVFLFFAKYVRLQFYVLIVVFLAMHTIPKSKERLAGGPMIVGSHFEARLDWQ
tara:strand:- start:14059 stop:14238 length:180 start_codon:yes stop_codon:yes gene_type:complete